MIDKGAAIPDPVSYTHLDVYKRQLYYNARAMYENQNKGIFVYFTNKHCDYLLSYQPDIINDIVSNSCLLYTSRCV